MLRKKVRIIIISVISLFLILASIKAFKVNVESVSTQEKVFSGLHTLSIHVQDTLVHDSVFHFLADIINLPVYYYSETHRLRKYAGVYAGNIVLEPCGPYTEFTYANSDFTAIFFGLTFEPFSTLVESGKILSEKGIKYETGGPTFIYPRDSLLTGENITLSLMDKPDKVQDRRKLDSLGILLRSNPDNKLGIEYVSEIRLGYKNSSDLGRWNDLISPDKMTNQNVWKGSRMPEMRFIKSNIKEVMGITFKVRSLNDAKQYLTEKGLLAESNDTIATIKSEMAFGLELYFSEID